MQARPTTTVAPAPQSTDSAGRPLVLRKITAYVALTKPRVIELLLVTTAPVMVLAARGQLDLAFLATLIFTLIGGTLSAASANAFNCYIDRDIDAIMKRTQNRPLVTGALSPREALIFAWVTGALSLAVLWVLTTPLAAILSLVAILFYVFVYTLILKRRTPQNIVWGGAAGCMPVLIGWAAVTGTLDWAPLILFGIVFLWTPPHYWPLSLRYREDYASVHVPMLGVVRGTATVGLQVVLYAWATIACSLLLIPIASMGVLYAVVAALSGIWFLVEAHRLYSGAIRDEEARPMRVFHASITYLTLVFLAVGLDPLLHLPIAL